MGMYVLIAMGIHIRGINRNGYMYSEYQMVYYTNKYLGEITFTSIIILSPAQQSY